MVPGRGQLSRAVGAAVLACAFAASISSGAPVLPDAKCQGKQVEVIFLDKIGNDLIVGTQGPDVIFGGNGANRIVGRGGGDTICGGRGVDVINGGQGEDRIDGDGGHDEIDGGADLDVLDGGGGPDTIDGGGKTKDGIFGGADDDRLRGGLGNDVVDGGAGDDQISGQAGSDEARGDGGKDRMVGGPGADDLRGGQGGDQLDGGAGPDSILGEDDADIIAGDDGNDQFLDGGDGNDRVAGEDGRDEVSGGDGNDKLFGGAGHDFLAGERNVDVCSGGPGFDRCNGGAPAPGDISQDPDICRDDVETKESCKGPDWPRTWQLVASGTYTHDGLSETWNATITLVRGSASQYSAEYYFLDSTGQMHWSVQGQNSNNCTVAGGGDFPARAELGIGVEPSGYSLRVRPGSFGAVQVSQSCPPPHSSGPYYVQPLNDLEAADADVGHYEEGDPVLTGSRSTYPVTNGTASWQWTLTAGE